MKNRRTPAVEHALRNTTAAPGPGGSPARRPFAEEWWQRDAVAVAALLGILTLAWCAANGKWTSAAWDRPIRYLEPEYADFIGGCALFKTMAAENWWPLGSKHVARLAAPTGADWGSSPTTNEIDIFFAAWLVKLFGLFAGFNLALLVGHLAAALTCYVVARLLGVDAMWAFVAGLAFGLAAYLFAQSPHHLTCQYIFHVPLFALVWRWISESDGLVVGSRRFWCAIGIAFLTGMENPYFTNILCQLTLLGGAVRAWQERSRKPLAAAAAVVGAAALGFGFINLDTLAYRLTHAAPGAAVVVGNREYRWMDIYGLKLVDLFIPSVTHHSATFAKFGLDHRQASPLLDEEGCAYLGLLGGACLLWLVAASVRALVERRQADVPAAAWQVLWIVLMFTTGGLNAIVASFSGFTLFRTACRYSVLILLIVLLWAAERMTAWQRAASARTPADVLRIGSLTLVAAVSALVLWDQVPRAPTAEQAVAIARQVKADREFAERMEADLPDGAMVFQMPVMEFSGNAIPGVGPYDHFRPYIHSHDLRFSFGALPGDARHAWQQEVQQRLVNGATMDQQNQMIRFQPDNVRAAVDQIRKEGFAAIYVNRNGFPDKGKGLFDALLELGYDKPPFFSAAGDLACVVLDVPAGK